MPVVDVTEFMAEDGEEFVVGLGDFDHLVGEDDGTARKGEGVGARIEFSEFDVVGREAGLARGVGAEALDDFHLPGGQKLGGVEIGGIEALEDLAVNGGEEFGRKFGREAVGDGRNSDFHDEPEHEKENGNGDEDSGEPALGGVDEAGTSGDAGFKGSKASELFEFKVGGLIEPEAAGGPAEGRLEPDARRGDDRHTTVGVLTFDRALFGDEGSIDRFSPAVVAIVKPGAGHSPKSKSKRSEAASPMALGSAEISATMSSSEVAP